MGYLRQYDYDKSIQTTLFSQATGNKDNRRILTELSTISEIKSHLSQKYYLTTEFSDTNPYSFTTSYKAGQRAELNFPAYSATSAYAINALVIGPTPIINAVTNQSTLQAFICTTAISSGGETFNPVHWALLGNQYDIFYCQYPQPIFNYNNIYAVGDLVFWKDKVYTCTTPTVVLDHEAELQQGYSSDNMNSIRNVFPDDAVNGQIYWGTGLSYSVAAGALPTDTTKWTAGDNRNQQLVEAAVFIVYYKLCSRIAPENVSETVKTNYKMTIELLEMAKAGNITFDLPTLQVSQGKRILFGSNSKNVNTY